MIRILVICKTAIFISAIEPYLNKQDIFIKGVCKQPENILEDYQTIQPDIVLLDANAGSRDISGVDILIKLLLFDEAVKVIFVTNCYEERQAERVACLGAQGYFYRTVSDVKPIIACIKAVYNGEVHFSEPHQ